MPHSWIAAKTRSSRIPYVRDVKVPVLPGVGPSAKEFQHLRPSVHALLQPAPHPDMSHSIDGSYAACAAPGSLPLVAARPRRTISTFSSDIAHAVSRAFSETAAFRPKQRSLLREPGSFEGVGAMAEELRLAHLFISDREDLKEVDRDWDAALPASASLATQS
jgi:hypothetical protein